MPKNAPPPGQKRHPSLPHATSPWNASDAPGDRLWQAIVLPWIGPIDIYLPRLIIRSCDRLNRSAASIPFPALADKDWGLLPAESHEIAPRALCAVTNHPTKMAPLRILSLGRLCGTTLCALADIPRRGWHPRPIQPTNPRAHHGAHPPRGGPQRRPKALRPIRPDRWHEHGRVSDA